MWSRTQLDVGSPPSPSPQLGDAYARVTEEYPSLVTPMLESLKSPNSVTPLLESLKSTHQPDRYSSSELVVTEVTAAEMATAHTVPAVPVAGAVSHRRSKRHGCPEDNQTTGRAKQLYRKSLSLHPPTSQPGGTSYLCTSDEVFMLLSSV